MMKKDIELLAPAGDMERLEMAVAYGADAVYLAGNTFGMRSFAGNFSPEELKTAVALCRKNNVRVHVTCNTMPRNDEIARLPQWLEYLNEVGVNAIIIDSIMQGCRRRGIRYGETGPQLEENAKMLEHWKFFPSRQHRRPG